MKAKEKNKFEAVFLNADNYVLGEGDPKDIVIRDYKTILSKEYKYVFLLDSVGKRWQLSRKIMNKIRNEAEAIGPGSSASGHQ